MTWPVLVLEADLGLIPSLVSSGFRQQLAERSPICGLGGGRDPPKINGGLLGRKPGKIV